MGEMGKHGTLPTSGMPYFGKKFEVRESCRYLGKEVRASAMGLSRE